MRLKHLFSVLLMLLTVSIGSAWGGNYELYLTLNVTNGAPTGSTSTALTDETTLSYLQGACPIESADYIQSASKTGDVYKGKGSGGGNIPQACLKIGKASGAGSITFTLADACDNISKVEIVGYGWKNTTEVSVNSSDGQKTTTAQSQEYTFSYEITATKTITVSVASSAFCATTIRLYTSSSAGGGETGGK